MSIARKKIVWLSLAALMILTLGYYLRAYLALYHALALSPYEAFKLSPGGGNSLFFDKLTNYPLGFWAERILNPLFGNFYIIYLAGAAIIFALGRRISQTNLGGFLAFAAFALAPDNLLQYTGRLYASGLCYISIWAALLFLLRYLESRKTVELLVFTLCGVVALGSYHTGGVAFMMILVGLSIVALVRSEPLDKKVVLAFLFLGTVFAAWLLIFDFSELVLISQSFSKFLIWGDWQKTGLLAVAGALGLLLIVLASQLKKLVAWYPWLALVSASFLIFSGTSLFQALLKIGLPNYYSSAITLNNYLAQIILIHVFILLIIKDLFKKTSEPRAFLVRGWLWGLVIILLGLLLENYYARIIDFSAPLGFIAFGWYLGQKPDGWKSLALGILTLMLISQIMIYRDPFTMRRYYNQNEISSAQKVIQLNLPGLSVSDLRTAALLAYLGQPKIIFGLADSPQFKTLFYDYGQLIPSIKKYHQANNPTKDLNVILSESMKTIIYSTNIETTPLTSQVFIFYDRHFPKIYDDGLIKVYRIYQGHPLKSVNK